MKTVLFSPDDKYVYAIGASPVSHDAILRIEVKSGEVQFIKKASGTPIDEGYLSEPQKITFPTGKDKKSHASGYLYLPKVIFFEGQVKLLMQNGYCHAIMSATLQTKTLAVYAQYNNLLVSLQIISQVRIYAFGVAYGPLSGSIYTV